MAAPMPLEAPVTTATLPFSLLTCGSLDVVCGRLLLLLHKMKVDARGILQFWVEELWNNVSGRWCS
jgi:hypothetical protein